MSDTETSSSTTTEGEPVLLEEDLGPVRRLTLNRPAAPERPVPRPGGGALGGARPGRRRRRRPRRHPGGVGAGVLRRLRPEGRGRAREGARPPGRRRLAAGARRTTSGRMLEIFDHPKPVIAQVHGLLPRRRLRPDDDVRPRRRGRRRHVRRAGDPLRLRRRHDGHAVADRRAGREGAPLDGRGPRRRRRKPSASAW